MYPHRHCPFVTGFEKSHLPCTITNTKFEVLYLGKENRCLHAIHHHSVAIHNLSIHKLLNGWLAELPTIFDSFFTGYANTTSTPIGVEGGGW